MPRRPEPRRTKPRQSRQEATLPAFPRGLTLFLLALILLVTTLVRIRLLDVPLERDEGEYAYAGQLMLQGIPPYKLAYNMKLPGIYGAYALVLALLGQSARGIHLGLLLVNLATIVLVFALARRLFGSFAAVVAAWGYAILTVSPSVMGFAAHATHFVVLFAVAGVLLLLEAEARDRPWLYSLSGILLGLSFVMKQHGAVFVLFGYLHALLTGWRRTPRSKRIANSTSLLAGAALPFGLVSLWLWQAGVFDKFWFWCFTYAREYAGEVPLDKGLRLFARQFPGVVKASELLWILAAVGAVAVWLRPKGRAEGALITAFLVASILGVSLGLYFRPHYFILMLPAVAILAGAAVNAMAELLARMRAPASLCFAAPALAFALAAGQSLLGNQRTLFQAAPNEVSREVYGANPFPEVVGVGRYIAEHSNPSDKIVVLGSEPEVYFYSRRRSATGYIYVYSLMEAQPYARRMQEEMIREVETSRPEYLVYVRAPSSWAVLPGSEHLLLNWAPKYAQEHYELVGLVDILTEGSVYRWDGDARNYAPQSPYVLFVFRRRGP